MKHNRIAATYQSLKIKPVSIDVEDMLNSLTVMMSESLREKEFIGSLNNHDVFTLGYESYFQSQKSISDWNRLIFEFLDVMPVSSKSGQKKILPDSLKETVSNSSEVIAALRETQYEDFIY